MNAWMHSYAWKHDCIHPFMNAWVHECMNAWMHECIYQKNYAWMHECQPVDDSRPCHSNPSRTWPETIRPVSSSLAVVQWTHSLLSASCFVLFQYQHGQYTDRYQIAGIWSKAPKQEHMNATKHDLLALQPTFPDYRAGCLLHCRLIEPSQIG